MTYAGDISPQEAHDLLASNDAAVLIDVRTAAEWTWVGIADVADARHVSWTLWPEGVQNSDFVTEATAGLDQDQPILFLCRSGGRSAAAASAATAAGFTQCYNIATGFQGDPDQNGHRTGGWQGAGLPWRQS